MRRNLSRQLSRPTSGFGLVAPVAAIICLALLFALFHSVRSLYRVLSEVHSIYDVDVQALSLGGDLQFQIQENRRYFINLLALSSDRANNPNDAELVRQSDVRIGLLTGRIGMLSSGVRLQRFERAWQAWTAVRDSIIALALQGRLQDAREIEQRRGITAFDDASLAISETKEQLHRSSFRKVDEVWLAMRRAFVEVVGLVVVTLLFAFALVRVELKRLAALDLLNQGAQTLRESEERFRNAFEGSTVAIVIMDLLGRIVFTNPAAARMTGYSQAEMLGKRTPDLMADDNREDSAAAIAGVIRGERLSYVAERRLLRKDGTEGWVRVSVSLVSKAGHPAEVVALCEDITERKLAREQLTFHARHDSLTGLPNRRTFEETLAAEMRLQAGQPPVLNLLYIDLDGFKLVNDAMGHAAGDALLRHASDRLRACLAPGEFLARVGGDEFTVIQRGSIPAEAGALAARLLTALRTPFVLESHDVHVGASIGISSFPGDGDSPSAILQSADAAMYHAKNHKQEGFCFFDAQVRAVAHRKTAIESHLRGALERGELFLCFQPVYGIARRTLVRFEALCRWHNPDLGHVSPVEFIPAAESMGLIVEIGSWVLESACHEALRWQQPGAPPVGVAVNVSPAQFSRPDFVYAVLQTLARLSFPHHLLELELTESTLLRDRDQSIRKMHELRRAGISLSIDDFGTGYSSLSYLQQLPVDGLKIDRSFMEQIDSSLGAPPLVRSVIAMARELHLRVVTEGVETAHQFDIIRELGADEVQGYYFGRPEDAQAAWLRSRSPSHLTAH